ncbi:hypothetical protein [Methylobacterium sp. J-076]|uniref:hypothetical protein n=1 Tax=Methylobacterium sp. J-076 TaxID=2836655 RepID=UPI001FBA5227|nr:hypothetical protein [Methylobacterium sp. J-076]MCJ2011417.1 hypothetical protein [Methylobacterium sp. J-076]
MALSSLVAIGFLNAIAFQVGSSIDELGFSGALANTFGVSVIVWVAMAITLDLLRREPDRAPTRNEERVFLGLAVIFLLPVKFVAWIGLALLALEIVAKADKGSSAAKGGWILLAITVPMFWSKLVFSLFSTLLLQADTMLVSLVLGLERMGNVITLADGHTRLWIAAHCSSVANVSLTVLGWVLFQQLAGPRRAPGLGWCALCCGLIVALNAARICLMGLFPQHYDLLHGAVGAGVASWLMVGTVFGTLSYGARRVA